MRSQYRARVIRKYLLAFQIEDLDAAGSSSTQPVSVRAEDESVDDVTSFQGVQMFSFIQIPQHGDTILSTRRSKRAIRRD